MRNDKVMVVYHGGCIDGFTSAWVAWRYLTSQGFDDVEFFPAFFGGEEPDVTDKIVYMLDFSYSREKILEMFTASKDFLILDHHATAEKALVGLPFAQFDMRRSGAGMTWDHFFPDDARPWLVDYVEDRDLNRFRKQNSHTANAWVATCIQSFENWDTMCAEGVRKATAQGVAVEAYINRYVHEMSQQARTISFAGHDNIPIVNAPFLAISELLMSMSKGVDFSMSWFQRGDGVYQYSLRSDGGFDVGDLATKFGGGGHKTSAGFTTHRPVHAEDALVV